MKTLIIYSHPDTEGHCSTILKNVENELNELKEKYEIVDLYKIKFDPILHEDELYSAGKRKDSEDVKQMQKKIKDSKNMIFIYPIWWNNYPAILRGFIDRVFVSGFAFRYEKRFGNMVPVGLIKGKKATIFTTSGGSGLIFKYIQGSRGVKVLKNDTLKFCGIKAKSFHYGKAIKLTEKSKKKLETLVKTGIKWMY